MNTSQPDPEQIYARYRGLVRAVAISLSAGGEQAEDLESEGWAALLGRTRPRPRHLGGYLRTVLWRSAARERSRAARARGRERDVARPEHDVPSPQALVEAEETRRVLIEEILALDEKRRVAILARYHLALSERQAADRLGLPIDTLRSRLRLARAELRQRLETRLGGDPGSMPLILAPLCIEETSRWSRLTPVFWKKSVVAIGGLASLLVVAGTWTLLHSSVKPPAPSTAGPQLVADPDLLSPPPEHLNLSALEEGRRQVPTAEAVTSEALVWSGVVRDSDGIPVPDIEVVALAASGSLVVPLDESEAGHVRASARTDGQGRFRIEQNKGPRSRWLVTVGSDWLPLAPQARGPGEWTVWVQPTFELPARVFAPDGQPVAGAQIRLRVNLEGFATEFESSSGERGEVRLAGLARAGWRGSSSTLARDRYPGWREREASVEIRHPDHPVTVLDVPLRDLSESFRKPGDRSVRFELELSMARARTIRIKALDPASQGAVANAEVCLWFGEAEDWKGVRYNGPDRWEPLYPNPWRSAVTDAEGWVEFDQIPVVSTFATPQVPLFVGIRAEGFATELVQTSFDPKFADPQTIEVSLRERNSLEGVVVGPTGRPIEGAWVLPRTIRSTPDDQPGDWRLHRAPDPKYPLTGNRIRRAQSDGEGRFLIDDLASEPASILVRISHPNHGSQWVQVMRGKAERGPLELRFKGKPKPRFEASFLVLGDQGQPIAGAKLFDNLFPIFSSQKFGVTDSEGRANLTLTGPHFGFHALSPGYAPLTLNGSTEDYVGPDQASKRVLRLSRGFPGVGWVRDLSGRPVGGAIVRVTGGWGSLSPSFTSRTDEKGRFDLGRVPEGVVPLSVKPSASARQGSFAPVNIQMNFASPPEVRVQRLTETPGASLLVEVRGQVEPVSVEIIDDSGASTPLVQVAARSFYGTQLKGGEALVRAHYESRVPASESVRLFPGQGARVTLNPGGGGRLSGRVDFSGGQVIPSRVSIERPGVQKAVTPVASDGTFEVGGLEPGEYVIGFEVTSLVQKFTAQQFKRVTIGPGEDKVFVALNVQASSALGVRLGDFDRHTYSQPDILPKLTAHRDGEVRGFQLVPWIGADYFLFHLPPGEWEIRSETPGYKSARQNVQVPEEGRLVIELPFDLAEE